MAKLSLKDVLSGLIFIGFGVAFGVAAARYDLGTALRMGPGYFPLVLAGVLAALGLAIVAAGLLAPADDGDLGPVPWRGLVLLSAAFVFFGATVRGLGFVPSLFVAVLLSALASRHNRLPGAALIAAALTLACALIFIRGLGIVLPLVGPWLR